MHPERLDQPLRWRRPRMIFVNSMSDLFHELVPDAFIAEVFDVMRRAPHHTFQVLTKRPERARDWAQKWADAFSRHTDGSANWPLPNVWLGVSIENARFTWRADVLREIPAAVRFISAEPLLGSLFEDRAARGAPGEPDVASESGTGLAAATAAGPSRDGHAQARARASLDLTGIDWLIAGGESGPGYRPVDVRWIRELRDACELAGVAFFFKQWGGRSPKAGGRELDGAMHSELPAVAAAQ
jgi:protein gp37